MTKNFSEMLSYLVIIAISSYLFGNLSFARIIAKINKIDITKSGSGNPGTMNMLRTLGAKWGVLTFILDILKGFIPALVAFFVFASYETADGFCWGIIAQYTAGVFATIGHLYPVVYKFKGGKGVATTMGVFFSINAYIAAISVILGIAYIYIREYGGIGSLIMIFTSSLLNSMIYIFKYQSYPGELVFLINILALFFIISVLKHRTNILRMIKGIENKTSIKELLLKKQKN